MKMLRHPLLILCLAVLAGFSSPAAAREAPIQQQVEARLAQEAGARFGLVVATEDGEEVVAIRPTERFIPASNTKMLTSAAFLAFVDGVDAPDDAGGASVHFEGSGDRQDVVLTGHGDARLSSAANCEVNCLSVLADAVAARTRSVRHVIGDDRLFPDQRWSPGMSWNNIQSRYGTAISALTLDDNELLIRVLPGAPGTRPRIETIGYYEVENLATSVASGETDLDFHRMPNSFSVRLTGTIVAGTDPHELRIGIDDPAHHAAWRFRAMLEERGVRVNGSAMPRHRPPAASDDPAKRGDRPAAPPPARPEPLARLTPPPLGEDIVLVNKVSQNLHSELLMRRLGRATGTGSIEDGVARVAEMMAQAGVPRSAWDLSDGSGMSTYNRLSPRAVVALLRWASTQNWGSAWRESFPIAGTDGTLARRFRDTPLQGKLFAKTGTLNATNALSGYMIARSGRTLIFSFFANDVPGDASATSVMDEVLNRIAAEY